MAIIETLWFLLGTFLIIIILSTDPKGPLQGSSTNLFPSASEGQDFVLNLIACIIGLFFVTTLLIYK